MRLHPGTNFGMTRFAQDGVGDVASDVAPTERFGGLHQRRRHDVSNAGEVHESVDEVAVELLQGGGFSERTALPRGNVAIGSRKDPRRGALKEVELAHALGDTGNELNGARSRADDGDAFVSQIVVMVPSS